MTEVLAFPGAGGHVPTPESRAQVQALAQYLTHSHIAAHIDICEKTLRKHYRAELDKGAARLILAAGTTLGLFVNRTVGEPKQWLTASMFVMNTRGNWATKQEITQRLPVEMTTEDAAVL